MLCAMAYLEGVNEQSSNERATILAEMKTATAHYNENMRKGMTKSLKSVVNSKKINVVGREKHVLGKDQVQRFEKAIEDVS